MSFNRRGNRPRYMARFSRPIVVRRVATRPKHGPRILKRAVFLQAPPDIWQRAQNMNLAFNSAVSLQQEEVRVSTLKSMSL